MQESLSRLQAKEFHAYRLKKDSCPSVFLWVLPNISERVFFFFFFIAKHLCVTFSAEYPFFRYADLSQQKRFLQPWLL